MLLRPDQRRHTRAIRALRVAAVNGTLVELAHDRARQAMIAPRPLPARILYGVSFA